MGCRCASVCLPVCARTPTMPDHNACASPRLAPNPLWWHGTAGAAVLAPQECSHPLASHFLGMQGTFLGWPGLELAKRCGGVLLFVFPRLPQEERGVGEPRGSSWGRCFAPGLTLVLQLSQAGEERSTCPFANNGPASAQEARSDLFSLLCPLRPVLRGPSHCLNHFHDSVNSILRSGGRDSQPAQSRRHCSCGQGPRGLHGGLGGAWGIFAPASFPGPPTHCPSFLLLRKAESWGRNRWGAALGACPGAAR